MVKRATLTTIAACTAGTRSSGCGGRIVPRLTFLLPASNICASGVGLVGPAPIFVTHCGCSSAGRAQPCQG